MKSCCKRIVSFFMILTLMFSVAVSPAMADAELEFMATDITLSEDNDELVVSVEEAEETDTEIIGMDVETVYVSEETESEEEPVDGEIEEVEPIIIEQEKDPETLRLEALEEEFPDLEFINYPMIIGDGVQVGTEGAVFSSNIRVLADDDHLDYGDVDVEMLRVLAADTRTIDDAIIEARQHMKNRETSFVVEFVSDSEIAANSSEYVNSLFEQIWAHNGNPTEGDYIKWQLANWGFHASATIIGGKYHYSYSITPNYWDTADEEAQVDAVVSSVVSELGLKNEGVTDYEKILRIYKYITSHVSYGAASQMSSYSAYGSFVLNKSVCQGYTLAIYRLALEAGLDCRIVVSQPLDHAWNIIKIGTSYYNLDATWDRSSKSDPSLRYFLCGDKAHAPGEEKNLGDDSFREAHTSESGYYRPAWVDAYSIPQENYPCFSKVYYSFGSYYMVLKASDNEVTTCIPNEYGYCQNCGQFIGHDHSFDKTVEDAKYLATPATCKDLPIYYYSCICGKVGTETFTGSGYAAHVDEDENDVCDVCGTAVEHICTAKKLTKVDPVASTCAVEGNIEYYVCTCGKLYADTTLAEEITLQSTKLPLAAHEDKNDDGECDVCGTHTGHIHSQYTVTYHEKVDAKCTETGMKEYYSCSCGNIYADSTLKAETTLEALTIAATGHYFSTSVVTVQPTYTTEGLRVYTCANCGETKDEVIPVKTEPSRKIKVTTGNNMVAYADGVEVAMDSNGYIELPNYNIKVVTTFTYNSTDKSKNYPEQNSMKVYFISKDKDGNLVAKRDSAFDGIMQYMGASVRCDGNKGIRIITGIPTAALSKLKGNGLNGWKLVEYGTLVGNDQYLTSTVVLGAPKSASAKFNDKPFANYGSADGYTVGLTFNQMEQCKVVFSMRPYMKLSNGSTTIVLYGGVIHRSIGYVAWQNRNAYNPNTQPTNYNFIQSIIKYCGLG